VHSGFESPVSAEDPIGVKGVLDAGGGMQGIRRDVVRVDDRRLGDAATGGDIGIVDGLERSGPAVLGEIVVIHAEAAAEDGLGGFAERIDNTEPRSQGLPVIVRRAAEEGGLRGVQREQEGILGLAAAGGREQSEGGVVAQTVVYGETLGKPPGILGV
jgi:hypothetical protein